MSESEKNLSIPEEVLGTETGAAYLAGLEAEPVIIPDPTDYPELAPGVAFVRAGYEQTDLRHLLKAPVRIRAERTFRSVESFCEYVDDFDGPGEKRIYADLKAREVHGILDDHYVIHNGVESESNAPTEAIPSWCDHRANFNPEFAADYLPWKNFNEKALKQVTFGEFLEDNSAAITSIDAATLKEIVMDLEVVRTTQFKKATNEANGNVAFEFTEVDNEGKSKGQHTVKLPRFITVSFPIFEHGPAVTMNAALRYRLEGSELTFHFKLSRLQQVEDAAFKSLVDEIKESGLRVLI